MSDFLENKRREIEKRLSELRPAVEEFQQLEAAAAALAGLGGEGAGPRASASGSRAARTTTRRVRATGGARTPRARAKRSPRATTRSTTGRRGRPRGSGTRALQALELVKAKPGITIPELAEKMGIKQNYLYRVLPGLEADGKVSKQGRAWHPAGS